MEADLYQDLMETLEGIDPLEFVSEDPELVNVAQELLFPLENEQENPKALTLTVDDACQRQRIETPVITPSQSQNVNRKPTKVRLECMVCKTNSQDRYLHGIQVCNSCGAFIKRSLKNDSYVDFECITGLNQCPISSKSRVSCQKCRFNRCLQVGMVIPRKKTEDVVETTCHEGVDLIKMMQRHQILNSLQSQLARTRSATLLEKQVLERITFTMIESNARVLWKVLGQDMSMFRAALEFVFVGSMYPLYLSKETDDYLTFCTREAYTREDGGRFPCPLDQVSRRDRLRLAAHNVPIILDYVLASRVGRKLDSGPELARRVKMFSSVDNSLAKDMVSIYSQVSKNGSLEPQPIAYEKVYDLNKLGLTTTTAREQHRKTAMRLSQSVNDRGPKMWDPILSALTSCLILYTPDFIDLDEPKKAEATQTAFASMLYRYLEEQGYPNWRELYRNSMMASSYARELREMRDTACRRMKNL